MSKEYEIGDNKYIIDGQLVVGQLVQIANILGDLKLDFSSPLALMKSVGDKLPLVIAVVLKPTNGNLKDKDIDALGIQLQNLFIIDFLDMVQDFFLAVKPLGSKFAQIMTLLNQSQAENKKTKN